MIPSLTTMTSEQEFRDKWRRRIDGCGPYCSCLVIIVALALALFVLLVR